MVAHAESGPGLKEDGNLPLFQMWGHAGGSDPNPRRNKEGVIDRHLQKGGAEGVGILEFLGFKKMPYGSANLLASDPKPP